MLSILDIGPRILAYRAEGRIERDDIDRIIREVDRQLSSGETFRVYAEVFSLTGMSLDAFWRDILASAQRWTAMFRIDRAALVTDLEWLRRSAGGEQVSLPGIEIRTYTLAEQAEARHWLLDRSSPGGAPAA
jgi:hypothetical protein